ncbi:hypothetical protein ES288_D03G146800v1 [Gossypium darwinii]|uniref:Uncharacterized protein n=1 Tax=Gossypium darwinii TaxID=34276 RepID=A0A5D2D6Y1_GOSDA|nr:hypothetical protein ES288_D03G146800v1 [Gossypium darwinii]
MKCDYIVKLPEEEESEFRKQADIEVCKELGENLLPIEFNNLNLKRGACYLDLEIGENDQQRKRMRVLSELPGNVNGVKDSFEVGMAVRNKDKLWKMQKVRMG